MPDSNPRDGFFYLPLTPMIDTYNPSQVIILRVRWKLRILTCLICTGCNGRHVKDATYAIVKIYVTERNDAIKRHSNVITIWRTSEIEVAALLKNLRSETKNGQEKEFIISTSMRVARKIRPSQSLSGITRQAS